MPGTLTVGCKLPNGLVLQVFDMEEHAVPVLGGGTKMEKRAVPAKAGMRLKLNGWARRPNDPFRHPIMHGVALTHNVDADFFNEWLRQNRDSDVVKNGVVFAATKDSEVAAQAKDKATLRSGFEEVDRDNLPEEFRKKITTANPNSERSTVP